MRQFTLYRMFDFIGDLVYVGKSTNAFKRLDDHRLGKPWADEIVDISYQRFPDHAVLLRAETLEIPTEHPMPPSGGFSFGVRHGWQTMSHVGRFCCKSQLRAVANRDSVVLTRFSARSIHDGPSEE
jgi:hypothetical protein